MKANGRHALVVDDDPHILYLLTALLHGRGYQVYSYDNPLNCPLYTGTPSAGSPSPVCPDIIISDFEMPGVNGLQFMERLYAANCLRGNAAIITGTCMKAENRSRLDEMGVCMFPKPVAVKALYAWLSQTEEKDLENTEESCRTGDNELAS